MLSVAVSDVPRKEPGLPTTTHTAWPARRLSVTFEQYREAVRFVSVPPGDTSSPLRPTLPPQKACAVGKPLKKADRPTGTGGGAALPLQVVA